MAVMINLTARPCERESKPIGSGRRPPSLPRPGRASRRSPTGGRGPASGGRTRLPRQRLPRSRAMAFAPQGALRSSRTLWRGPSRAASTGLRRGPGTPLCRRFRARRRPTELDARSTGLRESDRNRLLARARAVLPFADVMHFLADELTSLRARRFPLASVSPRALDRHLFRHEYPPTRSSKATAMPLTRREPRHARHGVRFRQLPT